MVSAETRVTESASTGEPPQCHEEQGACRELPVWPMAALLRTDSPTGDSAEEQGRPKSQPLQGPAEPGPLWVRVSPEKL